MRQASLAGFTVLNFGLGLPAALVARYLADCGARVVCLEPPEGDPFYAVHPAYSALLAGMEIVVADGSPGEFDELVRQADICIIGGEDFPDLAWKQDCSAWSGENSRLLVLEITAYPKTAAPSPGPAVDLLVQARCGLPFEQYSARPAPFAFSPTLYGAALHGLIGLFAAIYAREVSGAGQIVRTSLLEGALAWMGSIWGDAEHATPAFSFTVPKDAQPLILRCADGEYVHMVFLSAGSKGKTYEILGIDDPSVSNRDSGKVDSSIEPRLYFGDAELLGKYVSKWKSDDLLNAMWGAGLAVERVLAPGDNWTDDLVAGIFTEEIDGVGVRVANPVLVDSHRAPQAPVASIDRLRAIDFGTYLAGPYATSFLRDLGMDVIKIEPLLGDPGRGVFRAFSSVNRGKRTIEIDLKTKEGKEIALRLCASADVVESNFRDGVTQRLGIDAPALHLLKPELVVLECGAYGKRADIRGRAGFDMVFQALCGHEHRAGGAGNAPAWNRSAMVDYATGMLGCIGALQGLVGRARAGDGAEIEVSLFGAGIYLLSEWIRAPDGAMRGPPPINADQTGSHPAEQLYQTSDGWIAVAARSDAAAERLATGVGLTDVAAKPRSRWGQAEREAIQQCIKRLPSEAVLQILSSAAVWAERCVASGPATLFGDDRLREGGVIFTSQDAIFGELTQIGPGFSMSETQAIGRGPPPSRGQHSREILAELGYTTDAIDDLFRRKIVA